MSARPQPVDRIRELQRNRDDHAKQLDEIRAKIARADERRRTDRANERKWNRILDQLEGSMDDIKSMIAACDGELIQLRAGGAVEKDKLPEPRKSVPASNPKEKAKDLLSRPEASHAATVRSALEKAYGGRAEEITLAEATALLNDFQENHARPNLSSLEARRLDAIRSALPIIAERMKDWQVRWSHIGR